MIRKQNNNTHIKIKKENINVRDSNYELMRIISMFFIVLYHVLSHGQIIDHSKGLMQILCIIIETVIFVHVNSFIILTGYFQCNSKFHLTKVISINNKTWFYKVVMMFALVALGLIAMPDTITLLETILPIDNGTYWYISCYLVLYLISPILNKVINNSTKKELQTTTIILFFIISILSTISSDGYFNTVCGRSVPTFILLYFIGAYLRKYPIEESYIIKKMTTTSRRLFYFIGFFFFAALSVFCWITYIKLINISPLAKELGGVFNYSHYSYASPIVILQTIFYFLFFKTFSFKNKFINKISAYTLGIYLISENYFLREILYDKIGLTSVYNITFKVLLFVFVLSIIIFTISLIIEMLRTAIFKFIYNSKLACKNRTWYKTQFEKLGLKISW